MKTYKKNIVSVPTIIQRIVEIVSLNLADDTTISVPQVNFKHGTWSQIQKEIIQQREHPTAKIITYPCVLMIHQFDEEIKRNGDIKVKCDFVIVTDVDPSKNNAQRETSSFKDTIMPIYYELREVMRKSMMIGGYNPNLLNKYRKLFEMGTVDDQDGFSIPDYLDGLLIADAEFVVKTARCLPPIEQNYVVEYISQVGYIFHKSDVVEGGYRVVQNPYDGNIDVSEIVFEDIVVDNITPESVIDFGISTNPDGGHGSINMNKGGEAHFELVAEGGFELWHSAEMVNNTTASIDGNDEMTLNVYSYLKTHDTTMFDTPVINGYLVTISGLPVTSVTLSDVTFEIGTLFSEYTIDESFTFPILNAGLITLSVIFSCENGKNIVAQKIIKIN